MIATAQHRRRNSPLVRLAWLATGLGVLACGVTLRIDGLAVPSLWLDEILNAEIAEDLAAGQDGLSPWDWLAGFERENGPLYYTTLLLGGAFTDRPELEMRAPAAVAGILGLLAAGWLGWRLAGRWGSLVALALTAVSPLHVVYSREGRTYALLMLFAQGLLAAVLLLEGHRWRAPAVTLGLGCALGALYTAATGAPLLATLGITAAGLAWAVGGGDPRRRPALALAASGLGGFLAVAAIYGRFPRDGTPAAPFDAGGALPSWLTGFTTSALHRTPFDPRGFLLLALAILGVWALARGPKAGDGPRRGLAVAALVAGFAVLPALVALAALAWRDHWLSIRYLSPALPAFLLLAAVGTVEAGRRAAGFVNQRSAGKLASGPVTGALIVALLAPHFAWILPAARREPFVKPDWRRAAELIHALAEPGDQVTASSDWAWVCVRFYLERLAPGRWEVRNAQESVPVAADWAREVEQRGPGVTWLVGGGHLRDRAILGWMRRFPTVADRLLGPEIHVHPDLRTLASTRQARSWDTRRFEVLGWARPEAPPRSHRGFQFDSRDGLFLGTGWGRPEGAPDGETFRWAVGRRAVLLIPPWEPGARRLMLRLRPYRTPQTVTVGLDGRTLGTLPLEDGWQDYALPLGQNVEDGDGLRRLTLDFAHATAPARVEAGSRDRRRLAAAVARVSIEGRVSPDPTAAPAARRPDPPPPASTPP